MRRNFLSHRLFRDNIDGPDKGRRTVSHACRPGKDLDMVNVIDIKREIYCIVAGLRVADIDAIKEYSHLVARTAAHGNIRLGAHVASLPYVDACHIFEHVIDTYHRQGRYRCAVQQCHDSCALAQCHRHSRPRDRY